MQRLKILLGFLLIAFFGPVFAADSASFDVQAGSYQIVFSGSLVPGALVKCQFEVEPPVFGEGWFPSVAIFFESEDQIEDGGLQVRLTALASRKERGWRHQLSVYRASLDRKAEINAHTGATESVMQLNMIFTDDESIVFFVGNKAAEYSKIDIAPASLTKWTVVAVGVKGTADCSTRLQE